MVTVVIANSSFSNLLSHSCAEASLFYKKQMDYSQNYLVDLTSERLIPHFGSFCLLNNTFEGYFNLVDRDFASVLNVANFFIHGNTFTNTHFGTTVLFGVNNIIPFTLNGLQTRILLSPESTKIIDPYLTDPLLLELFKKAIFTNPVPGVALIEVISSVFSFRGNVLRGSCFTVDSLLQISSVAPDGLIDISDNQFLQITGTQATHYNDFSYLFELQVTSNLNVEHNFISDSNMSFYFLKISETIDNSTTLFIQKNELKNSANITLIDLDTHSPIKIQLLGNMVQNCTLELAPLIHLNFREGASVAEFFNNRFQEVSLYAEGFFQIGLIVIATENNVPAQITFHENWVEKNNFFTRGLNPSVLGTKNTLISLLSTKSVISIKDSHFISNRAGTNTYFLVVFSTSIQILGSTFKDQRGTGISMPKSMIYAAATRLDLKNSIFEDNIAQVGGCILFDSLSGEAAAEMQLNVSNNTFSRNAAGTGGALLIQNLKAYALAGSITQNKFISNIADIGGAIYIENIYITRLTIANNDFDSKLPDYANSVQKGVFIYTQSIKYRNWVSKSLFQIANSTIRFWNSATLVDSMIGIGDVASIMLNNLTFIQLNDFAAASTLINVANSRVQLASIQISGLQSSPLIYIRDGAQVSMESSNINTNIIPSGGCLIQLDGFLVSLLINNSNISGNRAIGWTDDAVCPSPICVNSPSARLVLTNSIFSANKGLYGAVVAANMLLAQTGILEDGKIVIQNCTFESNDATGAAGAIMLTGGSLEITNSRFINNSCYEKGGAIWISQFVRASITSTLFLRNMVDYLDVPAIYGGALYMEIKQRKGGLPFSEVFIDSNIFFSNLVQVGSPGRIGGGGAIFVQLNDDILMDMKLVSALLSLATNNYYKGNIADYGADYSTNPYSSAFGAFNTTDSSNSVYNCYGSPCMLNTQVRGDVFHGYNLHIKFYDLYGQLIDLQQKDTIPSDFKMTLQITNQPQIYFDSNCSASHCIINGNDATIRGVANQNVNLTFNVTSPTSYSFNFVLMTSIRPCQVGEINDTRQGICTPCPKGSYSVSLSDKACHMCPPLASCSAGYIVARPGYWRPNNLSVNIYPCNNTKVCNEEAYGPKICALGYKGPYCLACDLESGYAASGGGCGKCPPLSQGLAILILIQLAIFIIEIGYIWYFRKINKSLIVDDKYSKKSIARVSRGGYMTIIMDYMQILTILKGYPLLVSGFLTGIAHIFSPSQTILFNSDCVFWQLGFSIEYLFYSKLVILVILPFLKWFLILSFGFAKKFIYSSYRYKTFVIVATQCMILIEQPSMLFTLSSYLVCKSSDPLTPDQSQVLHYIKESPSVTCYTDIYYKYRKSLVIPLLCFWGVFLPLCLLTILVVNRKRLKTKDFSMKFGTQYAIYRSKCYYWNLVQFGQKFILICFAQFAFLPLKTLGLTLFLMLIGFVILIRTFKPYKSIDLYTTDLLSTYAFILTIFLAVYGYQEDSLNEVISYAILLLNITFIAFIVIKVMHLFGFTWVTRCLSSLLATCLRRRSHSNFFFNNNYHQRAESMLHTDDVFVKRESRANSRKGEDISQLAKGISELHTTDGTTLQQSLLSNNSQIISTVKFSENLIDKM